METQSSKCSPSSKPCCARPRRAPARRYGEPSATSSRCSPQQNAETTYDIAATDTPRETALGSRHGPRAPRPAPGRLHRPHPAPAAPGPRLPPRLDRGGPGPARPRHARLPAAGRDEHRPAARRPAARRARRPAGPRPRPGLRAGAQPGHPGAPPAAFPRRAVHQRLRPRRRQPRQPDRGPRRHDRRPGRGHRRRGGARPPALLHLAAGRQRHARGRRAAPRRGARRRLPRPGGRRRLARAGPQPALAGDAPGRGAAGARAAGGQPAARRPDGARRPARPPQGRRRRQPDRLLRQPELRGPGVPGQGEVRALGGRRDALRGPGRASASTSSPPTE